MCAEGNLLSDEDFDHDETANRKQCIRFLQSHGSRVLESPQRWSGTIEFMNFSVMAKHLDLILDHIDMTEVAPDLGNGGPDPSDSQFMWYI